MMQKAKKRVTYIFGAFIMSLLGGLIHGSFQKDESLFTGVDIAYADITGGDYAGSDSGCSGSDSY